MYIIHYTILHINKYVKLPTNLVCAFDHCPYMQYNPVYSNTYTINTQDETAFVFFLFGAVSFNFACTNKYDFCRMVSGAAREKSRCATFASQHIQRTPWGCANI